VAIPKKRLNAMWATTAVVIAALASLVVVGLAPRAASAASSSVEGSVTITPNCYEGGFGSIQAVLTSPVGPVLAVSGNLSALAKSPTGMVYGGHVSLAGHIAAIYGVTPGTYDVQLSANDSQGTSYSFSGPVTVRGCDGAYVGIQADSDPDGGYLTYTNSAAVSSRGAHHASDNPSFLLNVPHAPIVGVGAVSGHGNDDAYYFAANDGGVYSFFAPFYGSAAGLSLKAPIVGMALTPDQGGYWLVGADGGVFAFGDAGYYGSMASRPLNQPIVGMSVDQATGGYWLVGRDGGIYAFHAPFAGSAGSLHLNSPIVGMESSPSGTGYRLVSSDGGVFSYNEPFYGSMAGRPLMRPIVGIAEDPETGGYWLAGSDGGVFSLNAPFYGASGS
jgi:hypothetical protein